MIVVKITQFDVIEVNNNSVMTINSDYHVMNNPCI